MLEVLVDGELGAAVAPVEPSGRHRFPGRLVLLVASFGFLLLFVVGMILAWQARDTQRHLQAARSAVGQMRAALVAGDFPRAEGFLQVARRHAAAARRDVSGFSWRVASHLPAVSKGPVVVRGLSVAVDDLTGRVLPDLVRSAGALEGSGRQTAGSGVDLTLLDAASRQLGTAASRLGGIRDALAALPPRSGVRAVDAARQTLGSQVDQLVNTVTAASTAARLAPPMLGLGGPRNYFLAIQLNAEARGTGGLVGAFAILTADRGRLRFRTIANHDEIVRTDRPVVDLGPEFQDRYGANESAQLLVNSNLSPHFPYAARVWTAMWQRQTGERLDGAIATDPVGLARLLGIIGPVRLPTGEQITADNAVALTEQAAYARYPDVAVRKRFLIDVAASVTGALQDRPQNVARLGHGLTDLVSQGRLHVWSRHVNEQDVLERTALGGALPTSAGPFFQLVVNNAAGGKLDYYLGRSVEYHLGPCRGNQRETTAVITLTNHAPERGLPDYVVTRADRPPGRPRRGTNRSMVSVYLSRGADMTGATLDGRPLPMSVERERSHPVLTTDLDLAPGQRKVIRLHLVEPASDAPPAVPVQPLIRPQTTRVSVEPCRPAP